MITSIKKSDITKDYKELLINGIAVNIPCGLSRDLCAALKYAESKNKEPIEEIDTIFEYLYDTIILQNHWTSKTKRCIINSYIIYLS